MEFSSGRVVAIAALVGVLGLLGWTFTQEDDSPTPVETAQAAPEPAGDGTEAPTESDAIDDATEAPEPTPEAEPIPVLGPSPDLVSLDGWLNTDAKSYEEAQGDVTIVQFWTFGCFNCKNTLPTLRNLYSEYADDGLEIIGVHAPEFDFEADVANIEAAVADLEVAWPVALDTNKTNFGSWQGNRRFWPRTYVIDSDGQIRFDHIGEGAYDELEEVVTRLLAETA